MSAETVQVAEIKAVTQKTYTVTLQGSQPRLVPYSADERTYRPLAVTVEKVNGGVKSVVLSGPRLKKDGSDGAQWASERLFGPFEYPSWLASIVGGLA